MITRLAVSGYRSLRDVRLSLGPLNVVTGANGAGKSSLYRALRLLAEIAQGRVIQSLAGEGGLQSTLWAGPETLSRSMKRGAQPVQGTTRSNRVALKLGFAGPDYGYAIDLGLPLPERPRCSDATRRSRSRAYGPANCSAAPMRLPNGAVRWCGCATTAGSGARCIGLSAPPTA